MSRGIESVLAKAWLRRGAIACLLWPVSVLFASAVSLRRLLYRTGILREHRIGVPVIVVGNIFVGGTGKTPLVIWLAQALRAAGYRPGVVSRGYLAGAGPARMVTPDTAPEEAGDEPVLIAMHGACPVAIGRDRPAAAQELLRLHPEVNAVLCDDGLQHYRLARDIEIAVFDERGIGNGWMLPAGPLREPASRQVDFIVVNRSEDAVEPPDVAARPPLRFGMTLRAGAAEHLQEPGRKLSLAQLPTLCREGGRMVAAAGIGNPERFFNMLEAQGLEVAHLPLPDHYDFARNPFAGIKADLILITEKDAVKCRRIDAIRNDPRIWVVPVKAEVDRMLAEKILENLRGYPTA